MAKIYWYEDLSFGFSVSKAFGGYEQGGNSLFRLENVSQIGKSSNWEEIWSRNQTKSVGRCAHAAFVKGNKLYCHGGYGCEGSSIGFKAFSMLECIDLDDFSCQVLPYNSVVANVERRWHQSFLLENKFFVYGGWNDRGPPGLDDMIYLNLEDMSWSQVPFVGEFPGGRRWHSLMRLSKSINQNTFLLFGGYNGDKKNLLGDFHRFDLEASVWTAIPPSPDTPGPRSKHNLVQVSSKEVLLIGGEDNREDTCQDLHIFHTDDQSWSKVKNSKMFFEGCRSHAKALQIHEHGVLVGGGFVSNYVPPFFYLDLRTLKT